jgi:hypothetical protein
MYLTLNNLITFTKYTGVDPEVGLQTFGDNKGISIDKQKTPRSRYFTLGISVGF